MNKTEDRKEKKMNETQRMEGDMDERERKGYENLELVMIR